MGGFSIREAALFDEDGVCMAVASVPETYKPLLAEGSGRFTIIRIWIAVESTDNIALQVDPGIVLATVEDVINIGNSAKDYADKQVSEHALSRDHPDATLTQKGFTVLSNSIGSGDQDKAATPAAVKAAVAAAIKAATQAAWELDNPVGTVRFFNQNINPNESWPWSEWVYTGENKTIRVAKADGSNVGTTGGSDTLTLKQANLPAVQISVSGETSEQPEQELTTGVAGRINTKAGCSPRARSGMIITWSARIMTAVAPEITRMKWTIIAILSAYLPTNTRQQAKPITSVRENQSAWLKPTRC